jgi:hypothetical protein
MLCPPVSTIEIEPSRDLAVLTETAQMKASDCHRQQARLKALTANFEKQRLTASPATYAAMRAEVELQDLDYGGLRCGFEIAPKLNGLLCKRLCRQRKGRKLEIPTPFRLCRLDSRLDKPKSTN